MYEKYGKRFFDVIMSLIGIIVFLPMMIVVALLIKIDLGNPVIFRQKRPGKDEHIFEIYKFRTMSDKKDNNGNLLPDKDRITRLGSLLRKASLDELPQLFNIIKGDMSIIGPRPLTIKYLDYYTDREKKRHMVRPGLSGLAQVNGRNNLDWDSRLELDVKYVENITFFNDIKLIFKTVGKVLKREDIIVYGTTDLKALNVEREFNKNK
ncbi:sugar transferase [Clostridium perfringens]